jgi:hypothetical protein
MGWKGLQQSLKIGEFIVEPPPPPPSLLCHPHTCSEGSHRVPSN